MGSLTVIFLIDPFDYITQVYSNILPIINNNNRHVSVSATSCLYIRPVGVKQKKKKKLRM